MRTAVLALLAGAAISAVLALPTLAFLTVLGGTAAVAVIRIGRAA